MAAKRISTVALRAGLLLSLGLMCACTKGPAPKTKLRDFGTLPAWSFVDETGAAIGSEQLKGRPWVANFIFTTCRAACPRIAAASKHLQDRMRRWMPKTGPVPAQIVSVTVDPVTDTPQRLKDFAEGFQADPRIWKFARGPYPEMESLVTVGFHQALERSDEHTPKAERIKNLTPIDTAHSVHLVLVDGAGHIRGFYEIDEDSLSRLDNALQTLTREPTP